MQKQMPPYFVKEKLVFKNPQIACPLSPFWGLKNANFCLCPVHAHHISQTFFYTFGAQLYIQEKSPNTVNRHSKYYLRDI